MSSLASRKCWGRPSTSPLLVPDSHRVGSEAARWWSGGGLRGGWADIAAGASCLCTVLQQPKAGKQGSETVFQAFAAACLCCCFHVLAPPFGGPSALALSPGCLCLENPMDRGAWWAAVPGVTKSQTRLSDFSFTHWRRKWQPIPVFLPGESQGQRNLVGCHL